MTDLRLPKQGVPGEVIWLTDTDFDVQNPQHFTTFVHLPACPSPGRGAICKCSFKSGGAEWMK